MDEKFGSSVELLRSVRENNEVHENNDWSSIDIGERESVPSGLGRQSTGVDR